MAPSELLAKIKTQANADKVFAAMVVAGSDADAAAYGNERGYWGAEPVNRPLDSLQAEMAAGPDVSGPILDEMATLADKTLQKKAGVVLNRGEIPVERKPRVAASVLKALSIGKSIDFGDELTRQYITKMQESAQGAGDGLPAAMITAMLSLGMAAVTVTADDVSAALVSVRVGGTAELKKNWNSE